MRRLAALAALSCLVLACAHVRQQADMTALTRASETFARFLRWGDLRGASQLIVHESGPAWLDAALDAKDDADLKVTDVEADDLQLKEGAATTISKVTWFRLPSVSAETGRMKVQWVARGGTWYVLAIDGGPLPLAAPPADAGADAP